MDIASIPASAAGGPFLISIGNQVQSRTAAQVLADIGTVPVTMPLSTSDQRAIKVGYLYSGYLTATADT